MARGVRVGHDAGNLGRDVRATREFRDQIAPGLPGARSDLGVAAMVEHELNVGRDIGERDRLVELVGAHAKIERAPRSGKQA